MDGNHDDPRNRLLNAAGEVFAEKGYRAATIREICRRAGANVAAVNYYFGDKLRLYVAVVGYGHGHEERPPLPDWPPGTPPAEKLRWFVGQVLATHFEQKGPPWLGRIMMREMAEPTDACAALVEAYLRPHAEFLYGILDELLPAATPPADRHLVAFSIIGQCLFHRARNPVAEMLTGGLYGAFDLPRLADHITRFSLAALGHAAPFARRAVGESLAAGLSAKESGALSEREARPS